jgi:hypothetical protein
MVASPKARDTRVDDSGFFQKVPNPQGKLSAFLKRRHFCFSLHSARLLQIAITALSGQHPRVRVLKIEWLGEQGP